MATTWYNGGTWMPAGAPTVIGSGGQMQWLVEWPTYSPTMKLPAVLEGETELAMGWLLSAFGWTGLVVTPTSGWYGWFDGAYGPIPLPNYWREVALRCGFVETYLYESKQYRVSRLLVHTDSPDRAEAWIVALARYLQELPPEGLVHTIASVR